MKQYASSRFRIAMFAALILCIGMAVARSGFGQTMPAQPAPVASSGSQAATGTLKGPFSLVLENMDFVFVTIMALSITGVTLIIQAAIKNRRPVFLPESTNNRIRELITSGMYPELMEFTAADPTFVSKAINAALRRAPGFDAMKEAMETSVGEQTADQFRRIEYLNIIGNLGPLLGLLGTVLGMIEAFGEMNAAGGAASPGQLAGGISKALAHTMLGLLLAVPCLAAFGVLRTKVDRLTVQGAMTAEDLLMLMKPADARATPPRPATAPAVRPATPPMPQAAP